MSIPPELSAEFPVVALILIVIVSLGGAGGAALKWIFSWQERQAQISREFQEKQALLWREFMSVQEAQRNEQNVKRDQILSGVIETLQGMVRRFDALEIQIKNHHEIVEKIADKRKGGL